MNKKYILLVVLFITGCASSHLSSITAPDHGAYHTVLVAANYSDVGLRQEYESVLEFALEQNGIKCYRSVDIYPPLREYSDSERMMNRAKYGYDGVLILSPTGTSTTTRTDVYASENYASANTYESLSSIYTEADFFKIEGSRPNVKVYTASINTGLGQYTSSLTAMRSLANGIVDDLVEKGYLASSDGTVLASSHTSSPNTPWIVLGVIGAIALAVLIVVAESGGGY